MFDEACAFLKRYCGNPSNHGVAVFDLLGQWLFGYHHVLDYVSMTGRRRADWTKKYCIEITLYRALGSYDFDDLTRLVFLAHDYCIRVEVAGARNGILRLRFHPRVREGLMHEQHPTLEAAVEKWRERHANVP